MYGTYGHESNITHLTVLTAVCAIGFYLMSFFAVPPAATLKFPKDLVLGFLFDMPVFSNPGWISAVTAGIFLFFICLSIYYVGNRILPDRNNISFIPFMFLMLSTSVPESRFFSPFHIAVLLMVWSFYYLVVFRMNERHIEQLFLSVFLASLASLFYLPLIWFGVLLLFLNINADMPKFKYVLVNIAALLTPFLIYFTIIYLLKDFSEVETRFSNYLEYLKDAGLPEFNFTLPSALFAGSLALETAIAALATTNMGNSKVITVRGYIRIVFTLLGTLAIILFYTYAFPDLSVMLLFTPIAFLLFYLFSEKLGKKAAMIFFFVIAGTLLYFKISTLA
jgi:hypothetical protein